MPLKLNLKKGERLIINGALLSCLSNTSLLIHNRVTLLHENQIMKPDEANTPARRIYFSLQSVYMASEEEYPQFREQFDGYFNQFYGVTTSEQIKQKMDEIRTMVDAGDIYRALKAVRDVIDYEDVVLRLAAASQAVTARNRSGG